MKAKAKTNETMFRDLLKDLDPVLIALLRERVVNICEQTAMAARAHEAKKMFIIDPGMYVALNDIVQKHLGFGDN